ncbi:TPA: hypothetical protein ACOEOO_001854 [Stenotrophomonas maltophilia]|uniref:hypothetical protein n=1 Tax=Stenotrophomonas maltophilia group TaxID=995085 RepID=UPI001122BFD3|nr:MULTISPECIES: hypothetical protein [Stenotrophomonas maltophilia group]MDH2038292.1 hypothetical protein [Stenotrophomonas maltophilia]MDT3488686.1 hypothetical protein [Stenotrophomonas maltophilia group sp. msm4]TNY01987.1 hypothetical protein FIU09_01890 [Stenotrophomonas maltophilia]TPD81648.1 hypothetical protein FJN21_00685 [Stenotrophomonas maltophilia]TPD83153.1 hypothetical protein FJN20_09490 [Stenotrophomonas maltophilia]
MKKMKDLSAALNVVHQSRHEAVIHESLEDVLPSDKVGAGDEPGRETYFQFEEGALSRRNKQTGRRVHLLLGMPGDLASKPSLHDYRTDEGKRANRMMMTVPPKLREQFRKLTGAEFDYEVPIATSIIALASYAAQRLMDERKCLTVKAWEDERKSQRQLYRRVVKKRNGRN